MSFQELRTTRQNLGQICATQACLDRVHAREHPMCVVCASQNPSSLRLKFKVQPDGGVTAVFDCLPALQSYPDVLHGGVISAILDSAMVNVLFAVDIVAVTATMELRYLAPTATGRFAMVRAWTESSAAHPLYLQRAELVQDGKTMVEARAKFLVRNAY